jgi:uncharacterized repeat protein (TIGR03803 family)
MRKSSLARAALTALIAVAVMGTAAARPSFSVIYRFTGGNDGISPAGDLVFDHKGNLYGTTEEGGGFGCALKVGCGIVFQLRPPAAGTGEWTETVLHRFRGGSDGEDPVSGAVFGPSGALYGMTFGDLQGSQDLGGVFELQPQTGALTPLVRFGYPDTSGGTYPSSIPAFDSSGTLYGTAGAGGDEDRGVVFKLTRAAGLWHETVLYSFCKVAHCTDGSFPSGRLTLGNSGALYGTTYAGGTYAGVAHHDNGVIFRLRPTGELDVLHNFCDEPFCKDGASPQAGVIVDNRGAVYGTASTCVGPCRGTVFKVTLSHGNAQYTVLHRFCTREKTCLDGATPDGDLIMDRAGALYGTTNEGGAFGAGVVFKLSNYVYDVLHSFSPAGGGQRRQPFYPHAGLTIDAAGALYGVTTYGGVVSSECPAGCGTVFKITQ